MFAIALVLQELDQRRVQIVRAFRDVEERVATSVQRTIESRNAPERLSRVSVGQGKLHQHAKFSDDVALYDGIVQVADDSEFGIGRRNQYPPGCDRLDRLAPKGRA